ncbi:MAG: hypothetical protein IID59_01090 [Proteobacteria bacterium]|nr:hypothetical protein [Pseudomonadota bacterium]
MRYLKLVTACILFLSPAMAFGGIDADDLPSATTWYVHVDFREMQSSTAGKSLWDWLDGEVFEEIRDDAEIDVATEVDRITAYATDENGVVFVLEGAISQATKDKVLAAAAGARKFDMLKYQRKTYYFVERDEDDNNDIDIDGFNNELYFSFAVNNKLIAATSEQQLQAMLANGGKIAGSKSHNGALFILTAERSLIQAGMDTEGFDEEEGGFKSNILRNTNHAAILVADIADNIVVEAQLTTAEPEMAESLASIVRGLVAITAFSDDLDPNLSATLRSIKVDVTDNKLKVSVIVSPEVIKAAMDEA